VENTVVVAHLFAMLIIPLVVAQLVLPGWPSVIAALPGIAAGAMGFGFGWGLGAVTFAFGIATLGLGLGFGIIMGLNTAVGSMIPMIRRWEEIDPIVKVIVLIGILVCIVGVAVCARAGALRERAREAESEADVANEAVTSGAPAGAMPPLKRFMIGLGWCVLSGVLSAFANLGFDYAEPIGNRLAELGADPRLATLSRWLSLYWGGYLAVLLTQGTPLLTKGTWKHFFGPGARRDFGLAVMMGALHFLAQIPYGMGTWYLGTLGTTIGWVINIASSLIVANLLGFLTGEWRKAPRVAIHTLYAGLAILVIAGIILAYGNSLQQG
jgi:L-rhamnose-H+ transport protein